MPPSPDAGGRIVIDCESCGTGLDAPDDATGQAMADWWRKTHDHTRGGNE